MWPIKAGHIVAKSSIQGVANERELIKWSDHMPYSKALKLLVTVLLLRSTPLLGMRLCNCGFFILPQVPTTVLYHTY